MDKSQPNLFVFPNVDALAPALRAYIIQSQAAGIAHHGAFKLAVSGGSLPKTLATALLALPSSPNDQVNLARWEIFFAHERAVPLDHYDSNYALLKKELLDKIPEGQKPTIHPIGTPHLEDLQEIADQYQQTLVASFAGRDSVRFPMFDLLLLGCGSDGHTCSLFPGHTLLREMDAWVAPVDDSPKPPQRRITLTLPVVTHAVRVAFVATGGGKKDILKQIFDTNDGLPCSLINEATGDRCSWFVDEPAIEGEQVIETRSYINLTILGAETFLTAAGRLGISPNLKPFARRHELRELRELEKLSDTQLGDHPFANAMGGNKGWIDSMLELVARFGVTRQEQEEQRG